MRLAGLLACVGVVSALVPASRPRRRQSIRPSTTIDAPARKLSTGGGDPKNKEKSGGGKGKHQLLLFDDPVNTREYVSRVLCTKVALSEGEAYDAMMTAHQAGMAVVGVYQFEVAENYCSQMKESGLVAAVKPVGDGKE
jgi:ATP-dependent Clp protease adapter protein ClpS